MQEVMGTLVLVGVLCQCILFGCRFMITLTKLTELFARYCGILGRRNKTTLLLVSATADNGKEWGSVLLQNTGVKGFRPAVCVCFWAHWNVGYYILDTIFTGPEKTTEQRQKWHYLEINSFCPSFCCTWRCDSLLLFWLVQSTRRFSLVLIGYLDIIGCFDSLISVWREMRTNSGLFCFSQLLRYLACFSKFSNNFDMAIFLDAPHTNFDLLQGFFSPTIYPRNYDGCLVLVLISSRGFSLVFSSFSYKSLF